MLEEPQDTAEDAPEGAVDAAELESDPGAPDMSGDNMAGPRAAAEERADEAAEAGARAAAENSESDSS